MKQLSPEIRRRLRGKILTLLSVRHNMQQARMDDVALTHALMSLAYSVAISDIVSLLQDMKDRGYVRYEQRHDYYTRRVLLDKIEITAKGHDLIEENVEPDPAVEL